MKEKTKDSNLQPAAMPLGEKGASVSKAATRKTSPNGNNPDYHT